MSRLMWKGYLTTYHIGEQRRLRLACTFMQSCQSLLYSHTWNLRKDQIKRLWPFGVAAHARLKDVKSHHAKFPFLKSLLKYNWFENLLTFSVLVLMELAQKMSVLISKYILCHDKSNYFYCQNMILLPNLVCLLLILASLNIKWAFW